MSGLSSMIKYTINTFKKAYMMARGLDYNTLSQYILNINKTTNVGGILYEASRCLKDILDYELFGFVIRNGEFTDIWVDPRRYRELLLVIVKRDFGEQPARYEFQYFYPENPTGSQEIDGINVDDVLSYLITNEKCMARMYVIPRRGLFKYHDEIINIVAKSIGVSLNNSMNLREMEIAATIDPLTGLLNRRALYKFIEHDIANARRHNTGLSIIMYDIDHFKRVNDTYGHFVGDVVLQEVSRIVGAAIRKSDYVARFGGEEFLIVLPYTPLKEAIEIAERLRQSIEHNRFDICGNVIAITSSFGVAELRECSDRDSIVCEADAMLYEAKRLGRNTVIANIKDDYTLECLC
ncbi:MAG: GGDEF domain-containing protein [Nitrospirae bacterium]|uniref:GGDEF domain-containing protein n=1 Tax=Candidatus Magnetobacterium casense TaxID=1455061 RepID=UPI0006984D4E|nr:GGDEF domain-containing protein [Candidatus Magnetobacterium casensis]MBF0336324.1 GGDEF domain-containing protein [Nitrospirota bacterium]